MLLVEMDGPMDVETLDSNDKWMLTRQACSSKPKVQTGGHSLR